MEHHRPISLNFLLGLEQVFDTSNLWQRIRIRSTTLNFLHLELDLNAVGN